MKRRTILPMPIEELEALSTKQLLGRLKQLHQCEESLSLSDRQSSETAGRIEFKQTPEWVTAYHEVKQVLSGREHVARRTG